MTPVKRSHSRSSSPQLGEDDFGVQRNPRTGRPIRRSAGRKSAGPGFVDWDTIRVASDEDEKESVDEQGFESAGTAEDDVDLAPSIFKRVKKPRRTPTPTPPVSPSLSPVPLSTPDLSPEPHQQPITLPSIALSINVQPGHNGPIHLQLDLNTLYGQIAGPQSRDRVQGYHIQPSSLRSSNYDDTKLGFLSLAAEIRNQIYRLVFVAEGPLNFWHYDDFRRSSQLLATCSQIYNEGLPVLYSANEFIAGSKNASRSRPFVEGCPEIGYTDFLRFLRQIGPKNVGMIRDLTIVFMDATSSSIRGHVYDTPEERRFVYDEILLSCLRNLTRNGRLRRLSLSFQGKKELRLLDRHFLDTIKVLKADEVKFVYHPSIRAEFSYRYASRQQDSVKHVLTQEITRKEKLYD